MTNDISLVVLHAKSKCAQLNVNTPAVRSQLHPHWVAAESDLLSPILVRTYHY